MKETRRQEGKTNVLCMKEYKKTRIQGDRTIVMQTRTVNSKSNVSYSRIPVFLSSKFEGNKETRRQEGKTNVLCMKEYKKTRIQGDRTIVMQTRTVNSKSNVSYSRIPVFLSSKFEGNKETRKQEDKTKVSSRIPVFLYSCLPNSEETRKQEDKETRQKYRLVFPYSCIPVF